VTYKPNTDQAIRTEPKSGEVWYFDNGIAATIMPPGPDGVTDLAQADPEDHKTAFKFNSTRDPMPVRRVQV
jgi:hypothetical protein